MTSLGVTFVTAYLKVYESEYDESRSLDNRVKHFKKLLDSGINICIFIEPESENIFNELTEKYGNLKVIKQMSICDLEIYKLCKNSGINYDLPRNRNINKDTENYMFLMLSKLEFLKQTIDANPYNSNVFCWLDFSLPYVFKETDRTIIKIKNMSEINYIENFLCIPGCWTFNINMDYLRNNVTWRFCGGVIIGDKNSLVDFYDVSKSNILAFLKEYGKLVWEVNYWWWLEAGGFIDPIWYKADHDDTIIDIPVKLVSK